MGKGKLSLFGYLFKIAQGRAGATQFEKRGDVLPFGGCGAEFPVTTPVATSNGFPLFHPLGRQPFGVIRIGGGAKMNPTLAGLPRRVRQIFCRGRQPQSPFTLIEGNLPIAAAMVVSVTSP